MGIVLELALILSRSRKFAAVSESQPRPESLLSPKAILWHLRQLVPNKSIGLNILAIAAGTAFLAFALGIYDGYRERVETIIYSLTPHIMLRPSAQYASSDEGPRDENSECLNVCRAPYSVSYRQTAVAERTVAQFEPEKVGAVSKWLANGAPAGLSASRVLFEEVKGEVRAPGYSSSGLIPLRVMGMDILHGERYSPRVDLTFSDANVRERFRGGRGILISDAFADEIFKTSGNKVEPGATTLALTIEGRQRDVVVAGIHRLGIHAISRNLIIAPYQIAANLISGSPERAPSYVGLDLADPLTARDVARDAQNVLRGAEIRAIPWQAVTDLFNQLDLYRQIIYVTLSLSILVTALNTFVNIRILIMERAQHIGITRAMGLRPIHLQSVFVAIGLLQSLIGSALGYGTGILVAYLLNDHINSMVREFVPITGAGVLPSLFVYLAILAFVSAISVLTCIAAGRRTLKSAITENLRSA